MGIEVGWRSEVGFGKDIEMERLRIVSYLSVFIFFFFRYLLYSAHLAVCRNRFGVSGNNHFTRVSYQTVLLITK